MACLFCEIAAGRIPSRKVYEDESLLAFHDIEPQAPHHVLVIPKRHIENLDALTPADDALIGSMVRRAKEIGRELGLADKGFRVVANYGEDAGYSVFHVHMHRVGGRRLGWPPG